MDRAWKIGIATGVISTALFLYCLDPILRGVGIVLFHLSGAVFQAYRDRLFAQAALGVPPDPALFLLALVLGTFSGIFSGFVIAAALVAALGRARVRDIGVATLERQRRSWRWMLVIVAAVVFDVSALLGLYNTYFQTRITTSFRQHTTAIASYINDQEMKLLLSRWTQMRGEADYRAIYHDLKDVADRNQVFLPDNLMFSATSL